MSDASTEPLTDEQLADTMLAIARLLEDADIPVAARAPVLALLAEVERLRPIVAQVAAMDDNYFVGVESDPDGVPDEYPCPFCRVDLNPFTAQHTSECPVAQARMYIRDTLTGYGGAG